MILLIELISFARRHNSVKQIVSNVKFECVWYLQSEWLRHTSFSQYVYNLSQFIIIHYYLLQFPLVFIMLLIVLCTCFMVSYIMMIMMMVLTKIMIWMIIVIDDHDIDWFSFYADATPSSKPSGWVNISLFRSFDITSFAVGLEWLKYANGRPTHRCHSLLFSTLLHLVNGQKHVFLFQS